VLGAICDPVCLTCSDAAAEAVVRRLPTEPGGPAVVVTATGEQEADVSLVAPVVPGDKVLVHAGAAIARLDPPLPVGA